MTPTGSWLSNDDFLGPQVNGEERGKKKEGRTRRRRRTKNWGGGLGGCEARLNWTDFLAAFSLDLSRWFPPAPVCFGVFFFCLRLDKEEIRLGEEETQGR